MKNKITEILIASFLFMAAITAFGPAARAAVWSDSKNESKLDKDSYEKLVKKNLELRDQLDSLVKEQDQLRDVYKLLLEKVKTQQAEIKALEEKLGTTDKSVKPAAVKPAPVKTNAPAKSGATAKSDTPAKLTKNDIEPYAEPNAQMVAEYKASPSVSRVKVEIAKAETRRNIDQGKADLLQKDLEKALADKKSLTDKIVSAGKDIKTAKESIKQLDNEAKAEKKKAAEDEQKIKALQDSMDAARSEEKDTEAKLQEAEKNSAGLEEAMKKLSSESEAPKKSAVPAPKSGELNTLKTRLDAMNAEMSSLKDKAQVAADKARGLEVEINNAREQSKKELASAAASRAEKKKELDKGIINAAVTENASKKDLQHLEKKVNSIKKERAVLLADITSDDKKIADLKQIIAKEVAEIEAARGCPDPDPLTTPKDAMTALKEKNKELEKQILCARQDAKKARREAELDKKLPTELKMKFDKERLDMHYNLAVVYDMDGRYEDAKREYLKCLKINPKDSGVHYNLGILYDDKLNDNRKAAYHYRQYLRNRPMGEDAMRVRGWLTSIELEERLGKDVR